MALNPADAYAALAFMNMLKAESVGAEPNMGLMIMLNGLGVKRQAEVLEELAGIGAIENVDGRWMITESGSQLYDTYRKNNPF